MTTPDNAEPCCLQQNFSCSSSLSIFEKYLISNSTVQLILPVTQVSNAKEANVFVFFF